jgi:hypothetical protein
MRLLRTLILLFMAMGFATAGYALGAVHSTYLGLILWGMSGTAVLATQN